MYPTALGMRVCDCEAGKSRREYLGMSDEERRRRIRKQGAKKRTEKEREEVPF
jgi:hypothetical protein